MSGPQEHQKSVPSRPVRLSHHRGTLAVLVAGLIAATTGLFLALTGQTAGAVGSSTTTTTTSSSESSSDTSSSSASASESASATDTCDSAVVITAVSIQPTLSGGNVVVNVTHTGQGCPNATPATLHAHQNLLSSPSAGSDAQHQWNKDYSIGPDFAGTVSFPLLASADGECFVQVDVHAGTIHRGRFFPTTTCTSSSSSSSSSVSPSSSSSESSSISPSTSLSSSVPVSSSVAGESTSAAVVSSSEFSSSVAAVVAGGQSTGLLASTGALVGVPALLAIAMIGAGLLLNRGARRRRH